MHGSHEVFATANKENRLQQLPEDILFFSIGKFMSESEVQQLALGSKTMYSIFYPKKLFDKFLQCAAFGKQDKLEQLFRDVFSSFPDKIQKALRHRGVFTDYSGRTFYCSAYEYAYWAKDTHMCRMLEAHMDEETKAKILAWINDIDAMGLSYQQNDETHQSKNFDFTPLKTALQTYINGFDAWHSASDWTSNEAAWRAVGMAQRDVPAHLAQEYCRPDRSFAPLPSFTEETLPRVLEFSIYLNNISWFPLPSQSSGLGFDFTITRENYGATGIIGRGAIKESAAFDLSALHCLDEVRNLDLIESRENLKPSTNQFGACLGL